MNNFEYIFDEIESCECIGCFEDEYVYDIEVDDDTHTFIANDILVHNSLYLSYKYLIKTLKNHDKMSLEDKLKFIVRFNTEFMDQHNKQFIDDYYNGRHAQSVHNFELETVAKSGVFLDVKKRYAQILLWKDGKYYPMDNLPMKIKGLEIIRSSSPTQARKSLKYLTRFMLEHSDDPMLIHKINIEMQKQRQEFEGASIEDCCGNISVQNYKKFIINDNDNLVVGPKCPFHVRATAMYNYIRNKNKLAGDPIYGGKVKWYIIKDNNKQETPFAFRSMEYPDWAPNYAPINKRTMFNKFVIDPFNRIIEHVGLPLLNIDGSIQVELSLF